MSPLDLLNSAKTKKVVLHTSDGCKYSGILKEFDLFVNVDLSDATFHPKEGDSKFMKKCLINGNNITFVEI